jgi:hypothetical protein
VEACSELIFAITAKKGTLWLFKVSRLALARLFYRFHFNINRQQRQFFAAFWAFSIMLLDNFIWRFKLRAFV